MPRRYINEFAPQETVSQVFLATDKQLRSNRQGSLYLQVQLCDRTGAIGARLWNASDEIARRFDNGDFVHVEGSTQLFQGAMQLIATKIVKAPPGTVDETEFAVLGAGEIDKLAGRLAEMLRGMTNPHLAALAEAYLADEAFMRKFAAAPAGVKNHHAHRGGLLQHVVNLMEIVSLIAQRYPKIDRDQLLMGAFLHDSGKVDELTFDRDFGYSDQGQLLGHIVLAIEELQRKATEAEKLSGEPLPADLLLRLKHMIVSHHGSTEFGSPTVPMTLEAVALHHLDNLDAKIHHFEQLLRDDANVDSRWTQYHPNIGRKLYKGEQT
jgi:3'-5' exoribonuclease